MTGVGAPSGKVPPEVPDHDVMGRWDTERHVMLAVRAVNDLGG